MQSLLIFLSKKDKTDDNNGPNFSKEIIARVIEKLNFKNSDKDGLFYACELQTFVETVSLNDLPNPLGKTDEALRSKLLNNVAKALNNRSNFILYFL